MTKITTEQPPDQPALAHEGLSSASDEKETYELTVATTEAESEHHYSLEDILALVQDPRATDELKKALTYTFHLAYELKDSPFRDVIMLTPHLQARRLKTFTPGGSPFKSNPDTDKKRILGEEADKRELVELVLYPEDDQVDGFQFVSLDRLQFVSLVYSASSEDTYRYRSDGPFGNYAAPHELRFEGAYLFDGEYTDGRVTGYRMPIEQVFQDDQQRQVTFGKESVGELLRRVNKEPASCEEALAELQRIGEELEIDPTTLETMSHAVQDYVTYVKPEPKTDMERYGEIGRCFTVPHDFVDFCRSWYGMRVVTAFYEQSIHGTPTFFHQVNLFDRNIVIDWTARQYGMDTPYPFIYKADNPNVRASWGKLHGGWIADIPLENT